ncbi:ribonucleotide-diphosphate reductase subunit alpha [Weissella viridescens]|uniref:Ribonucleotide-diphosphate reductase subunit alpha n=1 Tax=Weissella viridescens TaxID=1629 RepID=A0A380P8X1_WEIVI|nr:ribonucleotide-diphosphate reductase subunit alpha [Weissella viridescens]
MTYFDLNNELNIPKDNTIQLGKDHEALEAFLAENVEPNTMQFYSLRARFDYLLNDNFIDPKLVDQYDFLLLKSYMIILRHSIFNLSHLWRHISFMRNMR